MADQQVATRGDEEKIGRAEPAVSTAVSQKLDGRAMKRLLLVLVIAIAAYVGYVKQHSRYSEVPAAGTA